MKKLLVVILLILVVGLAIVAIGCSSSKYTIRKLSIDMVAERPTWQVGDWWTYQVWRTGHRSYFYTLEVIDTKAILPLGGEECYKLVYRWYNSLPPAEEKGSFFEFYSKKTLEYLGKVGKDGLFVGPKVSQYVMIFPLALGNKWSQKYYKAGLDQEKAKEISVVYEVQGIEELNGILKLQALKIHRGYLVKGELDANYVNLWYCSEAKNFAKREARSFGNNPSWDIRDLVAYKVK